MIRVLLVDDDDAILDALVDALEDRYQVTVARDGRAALRALEAGGIDVVVLDLMMPVMDGEELLKERDARGLAVPVIVASAARDAGAIAKATGAAACLPKPYRLATLIDAIDRVAAGNGGSGAAAPSAPSSAPSSGTPAGGAGARRPRPSWPAHL
jgi:CheY-like chemotaxis protein